MDDLPDEILGMIFDELDMVDLKNASLVCSRWAIQTFSGPRMDRVKLKIDFRVNDAQDYYKLFQNSTRCYRVLELLYNGYRKGLTYFFQLLRMFTNSIHTITIWNNFFITSHQLRMILVEVPNVQHLSILLELCFDFELKNKPIEPFPVLTKLKYLMLNCKSICSESFNVCAIAPQLQRLKMDCDTEQALNVYRHFSGQLKFIAVFFKTDVFHKRFCELRFPCLEVLEYWCDDIRFSRPDMIESLCQFFQCLPNLRQLRFCCRLPEAVLQSITSYCRKLVRFNLRIDCLKRGSLASLAQLTNLKCLELYGIVQHEPDVFEGCKEIKSLEFVNLNTSMFGDMLRFCNHFSEVATNLSSLTILESLVDDEAVYFICYKFRKLKLLSLEFCQHISERVLLKIDQLPALHVLELGFLNVQGEVFDYIPRNTVRQLSIKSCDQIRDDGLLKIPDAFPSLKRFKMTSCRLVTEAGLAQLHARMPADTIIQVYGETTLTIKNAFHRVFGECEWQRQIN